MNIADFYFPAQNPVQKIYSRIGLAVVGDGNPSPTPSGETEYFAVTAANSTDGVKMVMNLSYCNVENATPTPVCDLWLSTDGENWTQANTTPEYYHATEIDPWDGSEYYVSTDVAIELATLYGGDTIYIKGTNPNGLPNDMNMAFDTDSYLSASVRFGFVLADEDSEDTPEISISGNLCTLLDPTGEVDVIPASAFERAFSSQNYLKHCSAYIPATEITGGSFSGTFSSCGNLQEGLDMRTVTTCADYSCDSMYNSCSSLNTIYAPCPSYWEENYVMNPTPFLDWTYGVGATGTFYAPAGLQIPVGSAGIPDGWTRVDYE